MHQAVYLKLHTMLTVRRRPYPLRQWQQFQRFTYSGNGSRPLKVMNRNLEDSAKISQSQSTDGPSTVEAAAQILAKKLKNTTEFEAEVRKARRRSIAELRGAVKTKSISEIVKENDLSYKRRYSRPSKEFAGKLRNDVSMINPSKSQHEMKTPASKLINKLGKPRSSIAVKDMFEPIRVGDAVELSTELNRSVLAVIAEIPWSHDDPRYTVMDRLGELQYVEKSSFKLRMPGVIPQPWLKRAVHKIKEEDAEYGSIKTTNDGFEMYSVNPFARSVIAQPLVELTNSAWSLLPQTSRKLEIIHRLLQTMGPRQVSLTTLVNAVDRIDLVKFEKAVSGPLGISKCYEVLGESLSDISPDFDPKTVVLGKEFGKLNLNEEYDIGLLYSVVLALRKQPRLWGSTNSSRSAFLPMSITVLPMSYASNIEDIIKDLKSDSRYIAAFHQALKTGKIHTEMDKRILYLLKEYAVGNLTDAVCETMVCQLMKQSHDEAITKSMVWDVLIQTGYTPATMTNPTHYAMNLSLPGKSVSYKADVEQEFFELVDVSKDRKSDMAKHREDYTHMNVYCIDSASAHEIDDGVSIEAVDGQTVKLHIHIADPVSYMDPTSDLTKVAYERAFTTYQPEMISAMLPQTMSKLAGLGINGKRTRAMTFSVVVDTSTGAIDFEKASVAATHLAKFPKYTYNDVDQVLSQVYAAGGVTSHPEHQELWNMKTISENLRDFRIKSGAVIFPDEGLNVQVRIVSKDHHDLAEIDSKLDDGSGINIDKQKETPSIVLVSEFMILANRIAAHLLKTAQMPGVFKAMPSLELAGSARHVVPRLNALSLTKGSFGISEICKALKFITPAIYKSRGSRHLMLGVDDYAPSTSPLRRFGDIVNHFQLHAHLNQEKAVFSQEQVEEIVLHIEARNDILKKTTRAAGSYYSLKYLREQLHKGVSLKGARFIVMSKPANGFVNGMLLGYGAFGELRLAGRKPPRIGESVDSFRVVQVDCVRGYVVLEQL